MYWRCKRFWPGDEQFSFERFGELPVWYVMKSVTEGQRIRKRELHEQELAVANLTALTANLNRDAKKQKTPYKLTDFCFFAEAEDRNDPDAEPAAAYMKLLDLGALPSWALFVYTDMKGMAGQCETPEPLAAIGDGFVLLAPQPKNGGMEGLMLATSKVSGQEIEVQIGGHAATITVPEFEGTVIAREHVYIPAT